jgi:hypothetical protein
MLISASTAVLAQAFAHQRQLLLRHKGLMPNKTKSLPFEEGSFCYTKLLSGEEV